MDRVRYDGHRRIRLPYLGSVKLKRELPEGIAYEVRIRKENASWNASVNYWKPPVDAEEKTHLCGAVDVGITPLAVDSQLATTRILKHWANRYVNWLAGNVPWRGVLSVPEAGTRRNGGSLPFTDAASDCGRTGTTR